MTTLAQAREQIYLTFTTDWAGLTPVQLGNEVFKTPKPTDDWVRVTVRHRVARQESLGDVGARKFDRAGSVFVQCFTPLDKGEAATDALATTARAVFEGKTFSPQAIRFTGVDVREVGPDRGWNQTNVEAPFNYTETK